jgi:hypothetical protein
MADEEAKAVQEVAKSTGKVRDVVQRVGAFIKSVVGDAATELGQTLGDWARFYRDKNLCRIQKQKGTDLFLPTAGVGSRHNAS